MDMTIDCPHCGTPLRVPESAAGRRGRCTECDQRFLIPSMQELLESTVSHFMVASIDAADDAEDAFEEAVSNDRPVYDMEDHYNQEALSILIDYLMLLKNNRVAIAR